MNRKIKTTKKAEDTEKKQSRKPMIILIALVALVIGLAVAFVVIESQMDGKLVITNDSAKNVSRFACYFELADGTDLDYLCETAVAKGETLEIPYDPVDLTSKDCIICFEVTYEGENGVWMNDGGFNTVFIGRIRVRFYDEDGENCMYAKASEGFFKSTKNSYVDTDFIIYPEEEEWEYKY